MLLCFTPQADTTYVLTQVSTIDSCPGGFLSSAQADFVTLSMLGTLFQDYFAFDLSLFEIITGSSIVAYALGFGTGAVIKMMMRT